MRLAFESSCKVNINFANCIDGRRPERILILASSAYRKKANGYRRLNGEDFNFYFVCIACA